MSSVKISCAFPPVPRTPDHIVLAEELGYETAWVYDTPALQLDCWMTLAGAHDVFDLRGIDRHQGALVIVRPDQYVAQVLPLDAHAEVDEYFADILVRM